MPAAMKVAKKPAAAMKKPAAANAAARSGPPQPRGRPPKILMVNPKTGKSYNKLTVANLRRELLHAVKAEGLKSWVKIDKIFEKIDKLETMVVAVHGRVCRIP